jgi:hypothetical protein
MSLRVGISLRRALLAPAEVSQRKGLPATSIARTLADIALRLPLVEAVVVADMALQKGLTDLTELRAYTAQRERSRGIRRLRRVLDLAEPASESPMETRLRLLLVLGGLPRPSAQVTIHDGQGRFAGRPDLYYPDHRLGLEYDGGMHRTSLVDDDRRQNRLLGAGVRLLRFTAADVQYTPEVVVAQVRSALSAPSGRFPP